MTRQDNELPELVEYRSGPNERNVTKRNEMSMPISVCTDLHSVTFCDLTPSKTNAGFYVSAVQVFRKHCRKRRNYS